MKNTLIIQHTKVKDLSKINKKNKNTISTDFILPFSKASTFNCTKKSVKGDIFPLKNSGSCEKVINSAKL